MLGRTMRRGLCTAAAEAPAVMFGTSGRYANALYAAAAKKKVVASVADDLDLLKSTISASPTLANFCSSSTHSNFFNRTISRLYPTKS